MKRQSNLVAMAYAQMELAGAALSSGQADAVDRLLARVDWLHANPNSTRQHDAASRIQAFVNEVIALCRP